MTKNLTKHTLDTVEKDLQSNDISTLEGVVNKTRNDFFSSLAMSDDFFVDQTNKSQIEGVSQHMNNKERYIISQRDDKRNKKQQLDDEKATLESDKLGISPTTTNKAEIAQLKTINDRLIQIARELPIIRSEIARLDVLISNATTRKSEYQTLSNTTNEFDLNRVLPDMKTDTYNMVADFFTSTPIGTPNYDIFDDNGKKLAQPFLTTITLQDGTTQEVKVSGITCGATLDVAGITLTDRAGNPITPAITQSYSLNIHVGAGLDLVTGAKTIHTIHTKSLKIIRPNPSYITNTERENSYDDLNTGNTINNKIDILHASNNTAREDQVIREMLSATGNKDEVDIVKNDPVKAKAFLQRFRAIGGLSFPIVQRPIAYTEFKKDMIDPKRKVPEEYLVSEDKFKDYIRKDLDKSIEEYLKKDIRKTLDTAPNRDLVLREFISFKNPLTQAEREAAYNDLNTGNTINDRINIEHTNNNTAREDEVIREILGESGAKGEMETLRKDEAQAKEFIKKIRSLIHPPVVNIATLQSGFKSAMIDPTRKVPEEYLITQEKFKDYLATDLDKNIVDHLKKTIKKNLDIPANRGIMMRELLNFQTELKNNKIDSTVDQDALGDLAGVEMDSKRWLPLFGRKDVNYMRFFSGASVDMGTQTVNLNKEVKYGMNLKISGKNEIMATVKIGDKKEKTYKAGNPMAMIEKILKEKEIPEGKTRLHVAYNVIAGMIQIAKKEDISLSYRDAAGHNQIIKLDGKNIILEDQDDLTNHATGRRVSKTLFDYSLFESTNSFEDPNRSGRHVLTPDNRTLRRGLEVLTKHFNVAMNQVNANYDCATERKGGILRSNTSSDFPTSAWTSPIKKLLNCKTTTNFDFATSVNHNGKSVQIERKGNTFFLTIDGVELKGKDLGKLLKKRKGGIRLFDGVERAICGEIYKNMVEKLRTNTKIARSSFGVMDPKTGRMYIIDEDGQLGYLRAEEADVEKSNLKTNPGVNTAANIALAGGLGAAGIATGGAAALAAGLSWGAAGTAASWGAMTAPGVAIFKDIRRIAGRGYGTLDHAPAARTMCDESETREIYKDPFLMGKLMKVMNLRLGQL